MNRPIPAFVLLLLAAWFHAAAAMAGESTQQRTLSTTGYGEVSARPDMADVQMEATTTRKAAPAAKQEVDKRINDLLDNLEDMGIEPADIVASTLNIAPNYEYVDRERLFSGYRATREVRVTLRDLDKLDQLLQSAVDQEVHHIRQIALRSSREEALQQKAFDKAIEDSRDKAAALAKAYGAELGPVHSIDYRRDRPMPAPKQEMALARTSDDSGGGRYLHDELTFTDRVEVVFELIIPR